MWVSCRTSCVFLGNSMNRNSGTWNMPISHRYVHGNLREPPQCQPLPPENKALLSGYQVPLWGPYFLGGGGWHCGGTLWFSEYVTIKRSSLCFAGWKNVFVWLPLVVSQEMRAMDVKSCVPAVNNAVCKKCEQGNLEKAIVAGWKGWFAEWNGLCFALRLQRVCRNMFYHVLSCMFVFLGGGGGQYQSHCQGFTMMVHGCLTFPFQIWFTSDA